MPKFNISNNFNDGVRDMEPRYNDHVPTTIKRMHFNEMIKPILSKRVLLKNIGEDLNFFPDYKYEKLEQVASKHYKINANEIVCTNGSDEGIDLCIRSFCSPRDIICVVKPGFVSYNEYACGFLCKVETFNLQQNKNNWSLDIDGFIQFVKEKQAKIVFLSNPLAHIGKLISEKDIEKIVKSLPKVMVIIDEAYIEFTDAKSIISIFNKYNNLTILRTVSKFFGLAGIRLGFIITHFKDYIFKVKGIDNVNKMTCQVGINLFSRLKPKHIAKRKKYILKRKKKIIEWLSQFDEIEKLYESCTNFIYIKTKCNSEKFAEKLIKDYKIKIRAFGGDFKNYCRISIL